MKYWLMKAEPNSRIEKGKDVKFSVDDFEAVKTTAWEGVRNHEAKKLMQSMKVGDQVLFYHSNCKNPGVTGFAEVSKEAYPDHTAWDPEHPYYDAKSNKDAPKWFMVDVTFKSRAAHTVPLSLFKRIGILPTDEPPSDVAYIGAEGVRAIKEMALIKRGRLSVQPVEEDAWNLIHLLDEKGGWEDALESQTATRNARKAKKDTKTEERTNGPEDVSKTNNKRPEAPRKRNAAGRKAKVDGNVAEDADDEEVYETETRPKKRKAETAASEKHMSSDEAPSLRRSTRSRQ